MASSTLALRLVPEEVRELPFGSIVAGYMGVGTAFTNPIRIIFIQNLTEALLMFSLNGIDDHFPLPANGFLLLDVTTNKTQASGFFIADGTRVYVRESAVPTTGSVYVSAFYGESN